MAITESFDGGVEENEAGWYLMVDPSAEGLRLDRFITSRIARVSRARAARLEVIDLDDRGAVMKKSTSVKAGQRLWVKRPMPDGDAEPPPPSIIYEDDHILVLDKPPGLAVHPTATRFKSTVTWWLSRHFPGQPIEPVHRLDVETSGILVCSKSPKVNRRLKAAFAGGLVEKRYLALTRGESSTSSWTVDTPLGFDPSSQVRLKMGLGELPAKTIFRIVETLPAFQWVEALPITGRQHQIRIHLALSGRPIIGDKLYGPDEGLFLAHLERALTAEEYRLLGHHRLALHASEITFTLEDKKFHFQASLPSDLVLLVQNHSL